MEAEKLKVEALFAEVEQRLADTSRLTVAERRKELAALDPALVALTREFERFQMIGFNKYPDEIDRLEERLGKLKDSVARMLTDEVTVSQLEEEPKITESDVVDAAPDPTKQLVDQTNAKLAEGKERAQNMLRMANAMRDELNMIDDEVMLQREKLLSINSQLKRAQSVTNQTKRLVSYFTAAVNDDKIVKGLIVGVAVVLLVVVGMAVNIKLKKGQLAVAKAAGEKVAQGQADFGKIDEGFFERKRKELSRNFKGKPVAGKTVKSTQVAGQEAPGNDNEAKGTDDAQKESDRPENESQTPEQKTDQPADEPQEKAPDQQQQEGGE